MPDGPELHLAARFVSNVGKTKIFGGKIVKSEVSTKNPDVEFTAKTYKVTAEARGKEMKVKKSIHQNFNFNMMKHMKHVFRKKTKLFPQLFPSISLQNLLLHI